MRISDLIDQLEKIKREHGDVLTVVMNDQGDDEPVCIALGADERDVIDSVLLCDRDTYDAFYEDELSSDDGGDAA